VLEVERAAVLELTRRLPPERERVREMGPVPELKRLVARLPPAADAAGPWELDEQLALVPAVAATPLPECARVAGQPAELKAVAGVGAGAKAAAARMAHARLRPELVSGPGSESVR
jgi:hypothetical protein